MAVLKDKDISRDDTYSIIEQWANILHKMWHHFSPGY